MRWNSNSLKAKFDLCKEYGISLEIFYVFQTTVENNSIKYYG